MVELTQRGLVVQWPVPGWEMVVFEDLMDLPRGGEKTVYFQTRLWLSKRRLAEIEHHFREVNHWTTFALFVNQQEQDPTPWFANVERAIQKLIELTALDDASHVRAAA